MCNATFQTCVQRQIGLLCHGTRVPVRVRFALWVASAPDLAGVGWAGQVRIRLRLFGDEDAILGEAVREREGAENGGGRLDVEARYGYEMGVDPMYCLCKT